MWGYVSITYNTNPKEKWRERMKTKPNVINFKTEIEQTAFNEGIDVGKLAGEEAYKQKVVGL